MNNPSNREFAQAHSFRLKLSNSQILLILILLLVSIELKLTWNDLWEDLPRSHAKQIWTVGQPLSAVAFSPDGRVIAAGLANGSVQLRSVLDGSIINSLPAQKNEVAEISFSPDGQTLAVSGYDGSLLWQIDSAITETIAPSQSESDYSIQPLIFTPDGSMLIMVSDSGPLELRTSDGQTLLDSYPSQKYALRKLYLGQDGRTLIGAYGDGLIQQWHIAGTQLIRSSKHLIEHLDFFSTIAFSPDLGTVAISWQLGLEVDVLDTTPGVIKYSFTNPQTGVRSLAVSPNSQLIASGGGDLTVSNDVPGEKYGDWTVHVWRLTDGSHQAIFAGHNDTVRCLSWSPDGKWLVSGSDDSTLRLWDVK